MEDKNFWGSDFYLISSDLNLKPGIFTLYVPFAEATAKVEAESKVPEVCVDHSEKMKDRKPPPSPPDEHLPRKTNHHPEPAGGKCSPEQSWAPPAPHRHCPAALSRAEAPNWNPKQVFSVCWHGAVIHRTCPFLRRAQLLHQCLSSFSFLFKI